MRYWDASALVPVIVAEPDSGSVRAWLSEDGHIVTWAWTRTEITGAVERRARDGSLTRQQRHEALERLHAFAASWDEVTEVLVVRARSDALLARHPVRAADAGQLGAALLVQEELAGALPFVCLDRRKYLDPEAPGAREVLHVVRDQRNTLNVSRVGILSGG